MMKEKWSNISDKILAMVGCLSIIACATYLYINNFSDVFWVARIPLSLFGAWLICMIIWVVGWFLYLSIKYTISNPVKGILVYLFISSIIIVSYIYVTNGRKDALQRKAARNEHIQRIHYCYENLDDENKVIELEERLVGIEEQINEAQSLLTDIADATDEDDMEDAISELETILSNIEETSQFNYDYYKVIDTKQ